MLSWRPLSTNIVSLAPPTMMVVMWRVGARAQESNATKRTWVSERAMVLEDWLRWIML